MVYGAAILNIIMLSRKQPDYLHDMLYYGFKSLGHKVMDLPSKPNLHTSEVGLLRLNFEEDSFEDADLLLVCEYPKYFEHNFELYFQDIKDRYRPKRVAFIDGSDRPEDFPESIFNKGDVLFRRELFEQKEGIFNLPFAAFPERPVLNIPKNIDILFCGSYSGQPFRQSVWNRLYSMGISKGLCIYNSLMPVERAQYLDLIGRSRVVISTRGYGCDCYRYWETPALGAVMLTEEIPIAFENDFIDGVECFKFRLGDLDHMESVLYSILQRSQRELDLIAIQALHKTKMYHRPEDRAYSVLKVLHIN